MRQGVSARGGPGAATRASEHFGRLRTPGQGAPTSPRVVGPRFAPGRGTGLVVLGVVRIERMIAAVGRGDGMAVRPGRMQRARRDPRGLLQGLVR